MKAGDFTEQAEVYRLSRPTYPATLVDALIQDVGVHSGDTVAEIGAGTGLFTQLLSECKLHVVAVEPNAEMRRLAEPKTGVDWQEGTFDATGLKDNSCAWVVAAQAFHWANPSTALPEMRRILRSDGAFTVLWNNRDYEISEVLRWTNAAIIRHVPEFDPEYRDENWGDVLTSTGDFCNGTFRRVAHSVEMSASRYVALWRSHNVLNVTAGPERFAAFEAELTEYLQRNKIDTVDVPYVCDAWSAQVLKATV